MKNTLSSVFVSALFMLFWASTIFAQCPDQLTNQSTSITLSPGYPRTGTNATGMQIGASCGLHIIGNVGATYARYEIPINVADNGLVSGDQIEISMDVTNITANFRYDIASNGNVYDGSGAPISSRIITVPSGATTLTIRLFTNHDQADVSGSFYISNLSVSKVGAGGNDTQNPSAPTLSSTGQTETMADLSWGGATDNVGVTGYQVYQDGSLLTTLGNVTSYQVTGLMASTTYNFVVRALDAAGNESVDSNQVSVTTTNASDTESPSAPVLSSTDQTDTAVDLSWNGATDNVGVIGYTVFQDNVQIQTNITATAYQVTGLAPSTAYNFKVQAYDAAGNQSPDSNTLSITTDADPGNGGGNSGTSVWTESNTTASYTGEVAIGRSTVPANYKLAVEGNIRAREIRVDTESWPDYVFQEDYDLPSLEDIQKHIREKGHLPNIPSAKEVEANGVELGEMNRLLLEKIEELTLYVIAQQKEIDQLKKEREPSQRSRKHKVKMEKN